MNKNVNDELIKELWQKGLSDVEISVELDISDITVGNHRRKLGLPSNRKKNPIIKDSDEEFIKICLQLQSDSAVARYYKTSSFSVKKRREKLGIEISNHGANPIIELTHKQKEVIFGGLMGDSYCKLVGDDKNSTYEFNHSFKQKEYVEYKFKFLENFPGRIFYYKRNPHEKTGVEYEVYTGSFKTNLSFNEFRNMFYIENKKHIPLEYLKEYYTPLAMAIHYMDDGGISNTDRKIPDVSIATCSFEKDELDIFSDFLSTEYGIENSVTKSNRIRIKNRSVSTFMNLIRPYVCESMKYKLVS